MNVYLFLLEKRLFSRRRAAQIISHEKLCDYNGMQNTNVPIYTPKFPMRSNPTQDGGPSRKKISSKKLFWLL
jgi:hypothetical protein